MAAEQSTRRKTGKRDARPKADDLSAAKITPQARQEHRFVDVDPWALMLEQLMEMPEEEPAERTRPKGK
jgi:hypothetical protein